MKKAYISPSVEVINVHATQLMAASDGINIISDGTTVNTSENGGSAQLGRENNGTSSVWDREW